MTTKNWAMLTAASLLALCVATSSASAQDVPAEPAGDPAEADIVVTATRSEVRLSDVPLSVSAYSQAALDQKSVRSITDIVRLTPGIALRSTGQGNGVGTTISIRGVESQIGASTTGIYIDDTPIQSRTLQFTSTNPYPLIFDLARVEVLRGPQGTLFGAGAEGGTVRFITPTPSLTATTVYGRAEVSAIEGGGVGYEAGVAVGAPIIVDKLGIRVSGYYRRDAGYVDWAPYYLGGTVLKKNQNSANSYSFRGALTFAPTETLRITPAIQVQDQKYHGTNGYWVESSNPSDGRFVNRNRLEEPTRDKFYLPSLNIDLDLEGAKLTSVTSYFHRDLDATNDYSQYLNSLLTGSGIPRLIPDYAAVSPTQNTQRNFSQELRLQSNGGSPVKWIVGAFYTRNNQYFHQDVFDPNWERIVPLAFGGFTSAQIFGQSALPGNNVLTGFLRGIDKQYALFGQVDWTISDRLTLTAGGRVSRTEYEYTSALDGPGAGGPVSGGGRIKETPFTPKVGVSYRTDGGTMVYASASKGFRIGGAQLPIKSLLCAGDFATLGIDNVPTTYKSDSVWNYEFGMKGDALERTISFDMSAYYLRWSNIQTLFYLPTCGRNYIQNAGNASSRGFDVSATIRPNSSFTLGVALGYNQGRYDSNVSVASATLVHKGDRLPGSPLTVNVSARNEFPIGDNILYVSGSYDYRSRYARPQIWSNSDNYSYDPYKIVPEEDNNISLRAGIKVDNRIDASVFVTNLLDTHPALADYHPNRTDPLLIYYTSRPRTFGLTLSYRQ